MKKLLALILAVFMLFSLVACGSSDDSGKNKETTNVEESTDTETEDTTTSDTSTSDTTDNATDATNKVAQYIEDNKADLLETFEYSFATSSGMTCTSSIKVEGNGFIINININELENVPAETKKTLQDTYDALNSTFVYSLETMQTELPELEYYKINVCDRNGELLAVILAENGAEVTTGNIISTDPEETPSDDAANKVAQYVKDNKAEILESFEYSFATSSGMTCTSSIKVEGDGFIISININELENVPAETKQTLQDTYDALNDTFVDSLELMQTELPELGYYKIIVCDKNGDVLATILAKN